MIILIAGFQRSGTTLTRELMEKHPDIIKIFHEEKILNKGFDERQRESYLRKNKIVDPYNTTWGDKVPFFSNSANGILHYIKEWRKLWKDRTRIIYLVRHPIDVAISNGKFGRKRGYNYNEEEIMRIQDFVIPTIIKDLSKIKDTLIVSYESLVTRTFYTLRRIFEFCNLDPLYTSEITRSKIGKRWGRVNSSRAFMYRWRGCPISLLKLSYDYDGLRNSNKIL